MKTFYSLALSMVTLALVSTACGDDEVNATPTSSSGGTSAAGGSDAGTGTGGSPSQGGGGFGGAADGGAGPGGSGQGGSGQGGGGQGGGMASGADCLLCIQVALNPGGSCESACGADVPCGAYLSCLVGCTNMDFTQSCFSACEMNNPSATTSSTQMCFETACNSASNCQSVW